MVDLLLLGGFVFHKDCDCRPLSNIKDVFISAAIGRCFLFQGIAVKIYDVNFVERVRQALRMPRNVGLSK